MVEPIDPAWVMVQNFYREDGNEFRYYTRHYDHQRQCHSMHVLRRWYAKGNWGEPDVSSHSLLVYDRPMPFPSLLNKRKKFHHDQSATRR